MLAVVRKVYGEGPTEKVRLRRSDGKVSMEKVCRRRSIGEGPGEDLTNLLRRRKKEGCRKTCRKIRRKVALARWVAGIENTTKT